MKNIVIYTDGSCSQKNGTGWGNGGWSAIIIDGETKKEYSGSVRNTSNNRMEMTAAIEGLKLLDQPSKVKLYSDSGYVVNAFSKKWIDKWQKNGWKSMTGIDIKNQDLWKTLLDLLKIHEVEFVKVKGHETDELNNRCDVLAVTASLSLSQE